MNHYHRNQLIFNDRGFYILNNPIFYINKENWPATKILMGETRDVSSFKTLWKIESNKLYLKKLTAKISFENKVEMDYFFGSTEHFFAEWYSGIVKVFYGRDLLYDNPFIEFHLYDEYLFFKIQKGIVLDVKEIRPNNSNDFIEYDQQMTSLSLNFYKNYISKFYEKDYFPEG